MTHGTVVSGLSRAFGVSANSPCHPGKAPEQCSAGPVTQPETRKRTTFLSAAHTYTAHVTWQNKSEFSTEPCTVPVGSGCGAGSRAGARFLSTFPMLYC